MKFLCGFVENVCNKTCKVDHVIPETNNSWDVLWDDVLFCWLQNSTETYSESSLKHFDKAFLLRKLTDLPQHIFYEVAGLTQLEFSCLKSTMQTLEHCVKSVQS